MLLYLLKQRFVTLRLEEVLEASLAFEVLLYRNPFVGHFGVNDFTDTDERELEILRVSAQADATQRERLRELRANRNKTMVEKSLEELYHAADRDENVIPPMLDCAREFCTLYEIRHALERVYGAYREPVFF